MSQAGEGRTIPFAIEALRTPGVWTPRPWSVTQPDTGAGNPKAASAEKGRRYFEAVVGAVAEFIVGMSKAQRGESPYM
jgi:creatinine amidohydrolase